MIAKGKFTWGKEYVIIWGEKVGFFVEKWD